MSRESICSISTFPAASDGSDMDNVVLSGTKGGGALKEGRRLPRKGGRKSRTKKMGKFKWREGEASFPTAHGCQGQLKWL